jgi:transposase
MAGRRVTIQPILRGADRSTRLTVRQVEVLRLTALGLAGKQIARHLGISVRTVEGHFDAMRQRTGAHSQAELVALAVATGLVTVDASRPARPGKGPGQVAGERSEQQPHDTEQQTGPDESACDETPPVSADSCDETRHSAVDSARCQVCGKPLSAASTGRPRRYCSRACQARAYRSRQQGSAPDKDPIGFLSGKGWDRVPGKVRYTAEFKEQAARKVVDNSLPIVKVARELGINESTLGFWVKDYRKKRAADPLPADMPDREQIAELKRRNHELEMEIAFLKKAAAYFAREHR